MTNKSPTTMTIDERQAWAQQLNAASPMKSDGCTGVDWLVRLLLPWVRPCCITHDWLLYKHNLPRADADLFIRECIESKASSRWSRWWFWLVAYVFYIFVRLRSKVGDLSAVYSFLWVAAIIGFVVYQNFTNQVGR